MSDLDRFVLQYSVDLSTSLTRLEKLHQQMGKVEQTGKKTAKGLTGELKGALDGLANSFGGLDGPMARVITKFGALGGAASVAGAAVLATLAIAAKGIKDMNAMSDLSNKTGIGTLSLENIQRNMAANSGGRVNREMTQDTVSKFSEAWQRAYVDPTGKDRLAFATMGINPTQTGPNAAFGQAAEWMKHNHGRAQGIGQQFGLDYKATAAMMAGGSSITSLAMTPDQIKDHQKAQEAADHVNKFVGDLSETLSEFKFEAADHVINALQTIGRWFGQVGEITGRNTMIGAGIDPDAPVAKTPAQTKQDQQKKEDDKKAQSAAQKQVDAADATALANAQQKAQWEQILSLFGSSVDKFSSAINVQQAWAAWAGELGKAGGLPGSSNAAPAGSNASSSGSRGLRNNNPGNLEYGSFAKAHGATGSDGRFATFATPEAGVAAHEALLSGSYLAKGLNTPSKIIGKYAPANENDQSKYLAFLKSRGFGPDAAITGDNLKAFVAAQEAFESGYGSGHGIGESRAKMNNRSVQQTLADYLGVPLSQIQRGGETKGDASWAARQTEVGLINGINATKWKLQALDEASKGPTTKEQAAGYNIQRGQLQVELRDRTRALEMMNKYADSIVAQQAPGDRVRTAAQMANVTINVNGATDPKAVAAEVDRQLTKSMNDVLNHFATGQKG